MILISRSTHPHVMQEQTEAHKMGVQEQTSTTVVVRHEKKRGGIDAACREDCVRWLSIHLVVKFRRHNKVMTPIPHNITVPMPVHSHGTIYSYRINSVVSTQLSQISITHRLNWTLRLENDVVH